MWTGGAGTHSSDPRRAAVPTPVEPQTRYGANGREPRLARLSAPGGGAAAPSGRRLLGHSPVPSTRPGPFRFGASSSRRSQPRAPRRGSDRPHAVAGRPNPVALSLPVSGARRQVLHGPAQLRRTGACHFLAPSCHPSTPRRMASLWPASSSLSSPRSLRGHLGWRPVGSCPGPLGGPSGLTAQTQIAPPPWSGRRDFTTRVGLGEGKVPEQGGCRLSWCGELS